jgi:hypothetical protein
MCNGRRIYGELGSGSLFEIFVFLSLELLNDSQGAGLKKSNSN